MSLMTKSSVNSVPPLKHFLLKWFSFECRKVIGFALSTLHDWFKKNSRHFFVQSEVQPKPIVKRSHASSHALRQLPVITSSFD